MGQIINEGRALLGATQDLYGAGVLDPELTGAFGYFVRPGGPTDFKNIFKGQAQAPFLGYAGNFAYYAIGSGYLPNSELDAGAGAYASTLAALGSKQFSQLTGPFFSDASAASQEMPGWRHRDAQIEPRDFIFGGGMSRNWCLWLFEA